MAASRSGHYAKEVRVKLAQRTPNYVLSRSLRLRDYRRIGQEHVGIQWEKLKR